MDTLYFAVMPVLVRMGETLKETAYDVFHKENGEVNIVTTVVLIGIAVALAVIFRDGIKTLLESLMQTITTKATDAVK